MVAQYLTKYLTEFLYVFIFAQIVELNSLLSVNLNSAKFKQFFPTSYITDCIMHQAGLGY